MIMNPTTHNMQYNCTSNRMPHWHTTISHDSCALGGVADVSERDDEERACVLGRGGWFDSEGALTRRATTHQHPVSPAIVIPRRRGASNLGRSQLDEDQHDIVTREYDMATWRMYFRIVDHRAAKCLSSSSDEPDRGGGPAGGVPIAVCLSEDEDSSWSMDTSDGSDSSALVHSRRHAGGAPIMRMMMMVPRRPAQIGIDEREEEEEQQEEETQGLGDDEEDEGIFQFDL